MSGRRADRIAVIMAALSTHEGETLTLAELAAMCGRPLSNTFRRDISYCRQLALDEDTKLSHCTVVDGRNVFTFKERVGDDVTLKALRTSGRRARTYLRNTGRHGEWESRHGETKFGRAYGGMWDDAARALDLLFKALEEFEKRMTDDDDDGGGAGARA